MARKTQQQEKAETELKRISYDLNEDGKFNLPEYKVSINPSKHQNTRRLESIAGGPLELNEDGTFNLETINSYLNKHHLELEIVYFPAENRYGFSIYRTPNPYVDEIMNSSKPKDFHSVKDSIHPLPVQNIHSLPVQKLELESKHVQENPNEIIISGVKYNYTPKKKDKK